MRVKMIIYSRDDFDVKNHMWRNEMKYSMTYEQIVDCYTEAEVYFNKNAEYLNVAGFVEVANILEAVDSNADDDMYWKKHSSNYTAYSEIPPVVSMRSAKTAMEFAKLLKVKFPKASSEYCIRLEYHRLSMNDIKRNINVYKGAESRSNNTCNIVVVNLGNGKAIGVRCPNTVEFFTGINKQIDNKVDLFIDYCRRMTTRRGKNDSK